MGRAAPNTMLRSALQRRTLPTSKKMASMVDESYYAMSRCDCDVCEQFSYGAPVQITAKNGNYLKFQRGGCY